MKATNIIISCGSNFTNNLGVFPSNPSFNGGKKSTRKKAKRKYNTSTLMNKRNNKKGILFENIIISSETQNK